MNLTKSVKWAMVCAGAVAFSASAQFTYWVEEDFTFKGFALDGNLIWEVSQDWSRSGGNDASTIVDATADT